METPSRCPAPLQDHLLNLPYLGMETSRSIAPPAYPRALNLPYLGMETSACSLSGTAFCSLNLPYLGMETHHWRAPTGIRPAQSSLFRNGNGPCDLGCGCA